VEGNYHTSCFTCINGPIDIVAALDKFISCFSSVFSSYLLIFIRVFIPKKGGKA
jgi:hypothetical protein